MMHLGKAAGACLEELVPKLGAVSYTACHTCLFIFGEIIFFIP